jgi:hypothetical protein
MFRRPTSGLTKTHVVELFMQIEFIGIITIVLGLLGWWKGYAFLVPVFIIATLFAASAAIILPALGGQSIQPSYLLLCFLALSFVGHTENVRRIGESVRFPRPGSWLLFTIIYGTVSTVFLPRIFSEMTYVFGVARTVFGPGITMTPLGPTVGNFTQTVYFIGDAVCFFIFYSFACNSSGVRLIVVSLLSCAAVNLCFAVLDVVTFWTHTADYLSFMRNASYRMLDVIVESGLKRISGSFVEASGFAYATAGSFAFCARLWLSNIYPRITSTLALLSFGAVILSTSSTGYVAVGVFLVAAFIVGIAQAVIRPVPRNTMVFVLTLPVLAIALILVVGLNDTAGAVVTDVADNTLFNKLSSDSGVERMRWNQQAIVNFMDTDGFGTGIGSVRASSFPVAVIANLGIIGAIIYGTYLSTIFVARADRWTATFEGACQSASRWACFTLLVSATVAGTGVGLGLEFALFAGLACACPVKARPPRSARPLPTPLAPGPPSIFRGTSRVGLKGSALGADATER